MANSKEDIKGGELHNNPPATIITGGSNNNNNNNPPATTTVITGSSSCNNTVVTTTLGGSKKDAGKVVMATKSKQAKHHHPEFPLERLPAVVLDKIFALLSPEDLRSVHQVSKAWKCALVSRPRIDSRRVDLVTRIRLNKENIARGATLEFATPVSKETPISRGTNDGKPGGRNALASVESLRNSGKTSNGGNVRSKVNLTTPTSRFLRVYEAGMKLPKGQQLFRCPECQSPVPSPISTTYTSSKVTRKYTQTPVKSSSYTPLSSTSSLSSSSNDDSGFNSIEVSGALSMEQTRSFSLTSSCVSSPSFTEVHADDGNVTSENITLSFIGTPDISSSGSAITRLETTQELTEGHDDEGESLEESLKTPGAVTLSLQESLSTSEAEILSLHEYRKPAMTPGTMSQGLQECRTPAITPGAVQCPSCSHRFCSKCQCTEHPGRECREIDGDATSSSRDPSSGGNKGLALRLSKKRTKGELRRAARL